MAIRICKFHSSNSFIYGVIAQKPNSTQTKNVDIFSVYFFCHNTETVRARASKFSMQVDGITSECITFPIISRKRFKLELSKFHENTGLVIGYNNTQIL